MRVKRALLSVSDKRGIVDFARGLAGLGVELLSTGGTAAALRAAGVPVTDVSAYTGQREILGGRVKTLHPKIAGGILQRRGVPGDAAEGIPPIDLVACNLYPFAEAPGIENIDIGGVTLLRAAAKNHGDVVVVPRPEEYGAVLEALAEEARGGTGVPLDMRRRLARQAFALTAEYDAAIGGWLGGDVPLRYGENPHQRAVFRRDAVPPGEANLGSARILHGKEMSHNNYLDADAALETARELWDAPAAVVVKHLNPCGAATGRSVAEALAMAWEGDAVSAYGSVIAVTRRVDLAAAEVLKGRFVEALVAPGFDEDALAFLRGKSKNIRLISLDAELAAPLKRRTERRINGGLLLQDADAGAAEEWRSVTKKALPAEMRPLAEFGVKVCKHVKSNAILIVREYAEGRYAVLGMGAGQPNRVDSLRKLACSKAEENMARLGLDTGRTLAGAVLVSDAFFPFADNVEEAGAFGLKWLVEPGGSMRDGECIAACDERGMGMVFTGVRHFLH